MEVVVSGLVFMLFLVSYMGSVILYKKHKQIKMLKAEVEKLKFDYAKVCDRSNELEVELEKTLAQIQAMMSKYM